MATGMVTVQYDGIVVRACAAAPNAIDPRLRLSLHPRDSRLGSSALPTVLSGARNIWVHPWLKLLAFLPDAPLAEVG
jgi:hypothetical protein